jgi:hypothetical protein
LSAFTARKATESSGSAGSASHQRAASRRAEVEAEEDDVADAERRVALGGVVAGPSKRHREVADDPRSFVEQRFRGPPVDAHDVDGGGHHGHEDDPAHALEVLGHPQTERGGGHDLGDVGEREQLEPREQGAQRQPHGRHDEEAVTENAQRVKAPDQPGDHGKAQRRRDDDVRSQGEGREEAPERADGDQDDGRARGRPKARRRLSKAGWRRTTHRDDGRRARTLP